MEITTFINMLSLIFWIAIICFFVGLLGLLPVLGRRIHKLHQAGEFDKANVLVTRLLRVYSRNARLLFMKARYDTMAGDYESALRLYEKMILFDDKDKLLEGRGRIFRGYFYLFLGRYDDALADYLFVQLNDLNHVLYDAYWGVVAAHFYQKNYEATISKANKMLALLEEELQLRQTHGAHLVISNKQSDAELGASYLLACHFKAMALIYLGHKTEAKDLFDHLAQHHKDNLFFHMTRGDVHFLLEDYSSTLADCEHVLETMSDEIKYKYTSVSGYNLYHTAIGTYAVTLFACDKVDEAHTQWRILQTQAPSLTSAEKVGKEFLWIDELIATAKALESSFASGT